MNLRAPSLSLLLLAAPASPIVAQELLPIDDACTSLLVTAGASADGSVIITYTCDGEFHPTLRRTPAGDHEEGSFVEGIGDGTIRQVPHTYAVVGLINEHQLAIGETTFGGRSALVNREGKLHYWHLMQLTLQRAKTAREAIEVMAELVEEYGYRSSGESFSIGDTKEAWILEMIGPGPGGKSALWVAVRVPDGHIAAHANRARIGAFPLDDPENCVYAENVIDFAIEKGWYDPDAGEPFSFCETYCPHDPASIRVSETRVWSIFRRAAPSLELDFNWHRGKKDAQRFPLTIRPEKKLTLADAFALMRDHYEGTPLDMTQGPDAGPFGNPHRNRPLVWEVDGVKYEWERPISTHQTGYSFVSQSRRWLPDPIGGVMWYGVDDTDYTCYTPFYACIDALPDSYATGSIDAFDRDSVWWVFNLVSNLSYLRYSDMIVDIRAVQSEIEGQHLALQSAVEQTALTLLEEDPQLMVRYLTDYCVTHAELVTSRYRQLAEHLITRYNDGYVGRRGVGYSEAWLRRVLEEKAEQFRLPGQDEAGGAPVVQPGD